MEVEEARSAASQSLKRQLSACEDAGRQIVTSAEAVALLHTRAGALQAEVQSLKMSNEGKAIALQNCFRDCKTEEDLHTRVAGLEGALNECKAGQTHQKESLGLLHEHAESLEIDLRDCKTGGGSTEVVGHLQTRVDILVTSS